MMLRAGGGSGALQNGAISPGFVALSGFTAKDTINVNQPVLNDWGKFTYYYAAGHYLTLQSPNAVQNILFGKDAYWDPVAASWTGNAGGPHATIFGCVQAGFVIYKDTPGGAAYIPTQRFQCDAALTRRMDVGGGWATKEGANCKQGLSAAMVAGTTTVNTTAITANSRIFLTRQEGGANPGAPYVSARVAGTSFTITSTNAGDTGQVAYEIFEPA